MLPYRAAVMWTAAKLREVPDRGHVELHRGAEGVEVLVLDGDRVADAGVVDEHLHAAESFDCVGDDPFAVVGQRQVGDDRQRAGERGGERLESVSAAGREDHGSARGVEDASEPVAQPRRRAGHDGDLSGQIERWRMGRMTHVTWR